MALTSTVYRAELSLADVDRGHYADHTLTVARHPSETDERMMVRILAFALNADERLEFCRGLSDTDEPDLWQRDLTGALELWIEVGQPDGRRLRRACSRAPRVLVYAYGGRSAELWWERIAGEAGRFRNLSVAFLPPEATSALGRIAERGMRLEVTVQDGEAWVACGEARQHVAPRWWKRAEAGTS